MDQVTRDQVTRYNALWEVALRLGDAHAILTYSSQEPAPEITGLLTHVEERLSAIIDAVPDEIVDAARAEGIPHRYR